MTAKGLMLNRREMLTAAGAAALGLGRCGPARGAGSGRLADGTLGAVIGQSDAAREGMAVLKAGGNAIDAAVTAALTGAVAAPQQCGIGGYGGHMIIAFADGRTVAIDYTSAAPAAARDDMYPLDASGLPIGKANVYGWRAAGVPSLMSGLESALKRFGTISLAKALEPAIRYARDGFKIEPGLASAIKASLPQFRGDPGAAKLYLQNGEPMPAGAILRNPDLAALLERLAADNSAEAIYRGPIAERIAQAFQANGGLLTADDMANYRARDVQPLELTWNGMTILTPPPSCGGATVIEALGILKALGWERQPLNDPKTTQMFLETLRFAWRDRLNRLGDPAKADVPLDRLLSASYAQEAAQAVETAVRDKTPIPAATDGRTAGGTIHLSASDRKGNLVALTLTHGDGFGARVAVDGLGLVLGHGMSRFDPRPGRPNSPGPGKKPLHNMCPSVVLQNHRPILAAGGAGGRRIPNSLAAVLSHFVGRGASLDSAMHAPRIQTEGGLEVAIRGDVPASHFERLKSCGYRAETGPSALVSSVRRDPRTGEAQAMSR